MDSSTNPPRPIKKPNGPSKRLLQNQSSTSQICQPSLSSQPQPIHSQQITTPNPDEEITLTQTCLCKTHTYTTTTTRSFLHRDSALCLCSGCRHLFGSLYHAASKWPLPLPNSASQNLKRWTDGRRPVWIYFCGTCGSQMFLYFHMMGILVAPIGMVSRDMSEFLRVFGYGFLNSTGDGGFSEWLVKYQDRKLLRFSKVLMKSESLALGWNAAKATKKNNDNHNSNEADAGTEDEEDVVLCQCQCESISFVITRPQTNDSSTGPSAVSKRSKYEARLCACTSCRLSGGMDFTISAVLPKTSLLTLLGQQILPSQSANSQTERQVPLKPLASYKHSKTSTRYFCSQCGALCFWESTLQPDTVKVALGLLYSASGSRAESWVKYTEDGIQCRDEAVRKEFVEAVHDGYLDWVRTQTREE